MRRLLPSPVEDVDDAGLAEAYRLPPGRSLRMDFVASPDGSITVDGRSAGLGSPGDKRVFRVLRALAFLTGTDLTPRWEPVLDELTRLADRVEAAQKARQPRRYRY